MLDGGQDVISNNNSGNGISRVSRGPLSGSADTIAQRDSERGGWSAQGSPWVAYKRKRHVPTALRLRARTARSRAQPVPSLDIKLELLVLIDAIRPPHTILPALRRPRARRLAPIAAARAAFLVPPRRRMAISDIRIGAPPDRRTSPSVSRAVVLGDSGEHRAEAHPCAFPVASVGPAFFVRC